MLRYLWIPCVCCAFLLACGGESDGNPNFANANSTSASSGPNGERIYKTRCVTCHGSKGDMGANGAANLMYSKLGVAERVQVITHGRKVMNPFKNILDPDEIQAVADYTMTLSKGKS